MRDSNEVSVVTVGGGFGSATSGELVEQGVCSGYTNSFVLHMVNMQITDSSGLVSTITGDAVVIVPGGYGTQVTWLAMDNTGWASVFFLQTLVAFLLVGVLVVCGRWWRRALQPPRMGD